MPRLLVFDTATERLVAAACGPGGVRTLDAEGGAAASATLLPQLHALLARAGLPLSSLQAIGFGRGPGAFTGLRTAASVAQGLAFGLGVPVLPLDSLLVVAEDARAQAGAPDVFEVGVAMDARMDEAYAAGYRWADGRWHAVEPPVLCTLQALQDGWDRRCWPAVAGSALQAHGARLRLPTGCRAWPQAADRAAALARLALQAWADGAAVDAAQGLPTYLRDKVALTTAERAGAVAPVPGPAPLPAQRPGPGRGTGVPASTAAAAALPAPAGAGSRPDGAVQGPGPAVLPALGSTQPLADGARASAGGPGDDPWQSRSMTVADLDAVHRIEVLAYSHPWSRGNFADSLAAGHWAETLASSAGGEPVLAGYFVAQPGVDELHLLNLTVAPAHQGRGLGRRLMAAVQAQARRQGLRTVWLEVRESNDRARALYRRLGFEEIARRRGYYPAAVRREDAVVMRRVLAACATAAEAAGPSVQALRAGAADGGPAR